MRDGEEGECDPEVEEEMVIEGGAVGAGVGGEERWVAGSGLGPDARDAGEGHTWRISRRGPRISRLLSELSGEEGNDADAED